MKKVLTIVFISTITLFACKKDNKNPGDLTGAWKLIEVFSNTSPVPQPAGARSDFTITFHNTTSFSGRTFKNKISNGTYALTNSNELRFNAYSSTEVSEDAWGVSFNRVLMSCMVQSAYPCRPSLITLQNDRLTLSTPFKDSLMFTRIR